MTRHYTPETVHFTPEQRRQLATYATSNQQKFSPAVRELAMLGLKVAHQGEPEKVMKKTLEQLHECIVEVMVTMRLTTRKSLSKEEQAAIGEAIKRIVSKQQAER